MSIKDFEFQVESSKRKTNPRGKKLKIKTEKMSPRDSESIFELSYAYTQFITNLIGKLTDFAGEKSSGSRERSHAQERDWFVSLYSVGGGKCKKKKSSTTLISH